MTCLYRHYGKKNRHDDAWQNSLLLDRFIITTVCTFTSPFLFLCFQGVSIKRPGPSQKKSIALFYFRAPQPIFGLYHMTWSEYLEKVSIKQPVFFSNSRSLERLGPKIMT